MHHHQKRHLLQAFLINKVISNTWTETLDWWQRHLLLPGKKSRKLTLAALLGRKLVLWYKYINMQNNNLYNIRPIESSRNTLMYVARNAGEIGGSLGIHGRSNTIQQIANKNKWLLRPRMHRILVNLWQPSLTLPPHLIYFLFANAKERRDSKWFGWTGLRG